MFTKAVAIVFVAVSAVATSSAAQAACKVYYGYGW